MRMSVNVIMYVCMCICLSISVCVSVCVCVQLQNCFCFLRIDLFRPFFSTGTCSVSSWLALVAPGQPIWPHRKHFSALSAIFNYQNQCQLKLGTLLLTIFQKSLTCVNAEHSTYLTAFNSFANFSPCSIDIGFCLFFANFSNVEFSSRKSICVPTNKNGVFWQ